MTDSILPATDTLNMMSSLPALSAKINPNVSIDKTSQDFEAMFATQMLQPMFEGLSVDTTFGGGHGEEVMRSFLLQEYGKMIAKSGKLGIAAQVKNEMIRTQETARSRGTTALPKSAQSAYQAANAQAGVGTSYVPN
jgi:peptidoglycan hydrolase FlgJ